MTNLRLVSTFIFLLFSTSSFSANGPAKVDVEVKNASLAEVLKLISRNAGVTILTMGKMEGTLTLSIKQKTVDQVLARIADGKQLTLLKVSEEIFVLHKQGVDVGAFPPPGSSPTRRSQIGIEKWSTAPLHDREKFERDQFKPGIAAQPAPPLRLQGTGMRYERIQLKNLDARKLAEQLQTQKLYPRPAGVESVLSFDPGKSLIVYGTEAGIKKLREMVEELDASAPAVMNALSAEVIVIKYVDATKLAEKSNPKDPANLIPGLVTLVPDARSNTLIVVGTEEAIGKLRKRVKELDRSDRQVWWYQRI